MDIKGGGWHIDVAYYRNQYHFLSYNYRIFPSTVSLTYYVSDDGINFRYKKTIMKTTDRNPMYSVGLYYSASLLDGEEKVRIYFSRTNTFNK